jgi:hypothetical protein
MSIIKNGKEMIRAWLTDGTTDAEINPITKGLKVSLVDTIDPFIEIAKGNVPGHKIMRGIGERNNVGTTVTGEDLWLGNDLSNTPSAPASTTKIPVPADAGEQMTIISESNADNGATATGALTVAIQYLDASGDEQTTTATMNGTAAVDLTPPDVRFIQDMQVLTVGSNGACEGNIRIYKKVDDTLVYSMIAMGGNQSLVPHKMVPLGKTLYLKMWTAAEVRGKRMFVRLRADCDNSSPPVRQQGVYLFKSTLGLNGNPSGNVPLAYAIPALSVVKASGFAIAVGGEASVHWWGVLVDD